jgi:molecular chaperone DnaJ
MMEKLKNSPNFKPGPGAKAEREERGFFDKIKDAFGS